MVNAPTYPTPVTHYYTTTKFMNGFKYNGHLTAEINDINLFNLIQNQYSKEILLFSFLVYFLILHGHV